MAQSVKSHFLPIYIPSKLVLLSPFTVNLKTGKATPSILGTIHSILTGLCYYIFHLYSAYIQMVTQKDGNFVTQVIDSYNQYAGCSICMIIILNLCYNQRKIVQVINSLSKVDETSIPDLIKTNLDELPTSIVSANLSECVSRMYPLMFLFLVSLGFMEYYYCIMFIKNNPTFSEFCLIMCYVPLFIQIMTEFSFVIYLLMLETRFQFLTSFQTEILKHNRPISVTTVRKLKRLFEELKQNSELLLSTYSLPLLLLIFHQFTAITTLSYDLAVGIVKYDKHVFTFDQIMFQLKSSGGWCLFFVSETLLLCFSATRFKSKYNQAKDNLIKLTTSNVVIVTNEERNLLQWFSYQVLATTKQGLAISACQLFEIDLNLFFEMIGVITTYLIILVQFDISQIKATALGDGN